MPPTAAQIGSLYQATRQAAGQFATYNFRMHFQRRTDEVFKPVIESLKSSTSPAAAASSSSSSSSSSIQSPSSASSTSATSAAPASAFTTTAPPLPSLPMTEETLTKFYEEHLAELEVLQRASKINKMFEGPKLVVEHPQVITSGGGAGMEASAGGGGQPE